MAEKRYSRQREIFARIRRHWLLFASGAICTLAVTGITLYTASLFRKFAHAAEKADGGEIMKITAMLVLVHLPKAVFSFGQSYLVAAAVYRIAMELRNEIYEHLQKLSLSFFERNRTGNLMSRMINDVGIIQASAGSLVEALQAPVMVLAGVGRMFWIEWRLALVSVIFVPLMGTAIDRIGKRIKRLTIALQAKIADVTTILEETLAGIRIVKSFGMEKHEIRRFHAQNLASYRAAMRAVRRSASISPVVEVIGILGVGAIILFGGVLIAHGSLDFARLCEFGFIAFYVSSSAKSLGRLNSAYQQTMAGADRIFELLEEKPDVTDAPNAITLEACEGRI